MTATLGRIQKQVLYALEQHGGRWQRPGGWVWDNTGTTARVLQSLAKYGLVEELGAGYRITEAGRAYNKERRNG